MGGIAGFDSTKTDTTLTTTTVSTPNTVGGNGSVQSIQLQGKGPKTLSYTSSDPSVALAAIAGANNTTNAIADLFKSGLGSIEGIVGSQSDLTSQTIGANSGAYQSLADLATTQSTGGGSILSKSLVWIVGLSVAGVVAFLLLRKRA
jgi:hypothetical protein